MPVSAFSGESCSSPSLPVATGVGSFHLLNERHSRTGELGAYKKYSDPSEYVKNGQAMENKPSIEGSEVEGACTMDSGMSRIQLSIGWA